MAFGKKNKNSNISKSKKQTLRSLSLNDVYPEEKEEAVVKIPESYVQEEIEAFGQASKKIEPIAKQNQNFQSTSGQNQFGINKNYETGNAERSSESPLFQLQRLDAPQSSSNIEKSNTKRGKKKLFGRKKQQKMLVEEQDEAYSDSFYENNQIYSESENADNFFSQAEETENDTNGNGFDFNSLETVSKGSKFSKKKKKRIKGNKKQRKITRNQERAMQQAANADVTGFDPARMIELPEWDLPPWARKVFFGVVIVAIIVGLFVFGYFETDFNTDGEPTVVSIETRNERMYVNKSDELLQEIIDCASYIEENTSDMSDYITISAEIQKQYDSLNADTTKLSKYTNVPSSMEAYHTKLLNVSLGVQKLQTEILQNYENSDYSDWRTSNVASMDSSLDTLHDMRFQIDERIWGDSQ